MKTTLPRSLFAFVLSAAVLALLPGCAGRGTGGPGGAAATVPSAQQDFQAALADINKVVDGAVKDAESPAGQKLLGDGIGAGVAIGEDVLSRGTDAPADIQTVADIGAALGDAAQLPTLSGSSVQSIVADAAGANTAGAAAAKNVSTVYAAIKAKGVSTKAALISIASGLKRVQAGTAPAAVTAP